MNGKQSYPVKITQPAVGNTLLRSRLFEKLDRWVDARAFEHCVGLFESEGGSECSPDSHALCRKAIALYRGHFLYDNITDFQIISYREKLKSAFVRNAGKYGRYLEESSQWEAALECYQKALEIDDLTEEFYRRLMICNQKLGRRTEVVEAYSRCVKTLSAVLDIKPSPMTTALYKSLLS